MEVGDDDLARDDTRDRCPRNSKREFSNDDCAARPEEDEEEEEEEEEEGEEEEEEAEERTDKVVSEPCAVPSGEEGGAGAVWRTMRN